MKSIICVIIALSSVSVFARGHLGGSGSNSRSHYVSGHRTHNGTYVAPHHRTNQNHTKRDNYNTNGNYNPHNGNYGTRYVDR